MLDFRIERRGHPPRPIRIYDSGRVAFCQGEEERLWQELVVTCAQLEEVKHMNEKLAERCAGQSEALGKKAEKASRR